MNLLVDIGNSRIKWAYQTDEQLSDFGGEFYNKNDVCGFFDKYWDHLAVPDRLLAANVGGRHVAEQLQEWSARHWHIEPEYTCVTKKESGVINAYNDVTRLGIDRWMALIAVWQEYHSSACIVDCGTAVTIDGLNANGEHLGGLIIPGVLLMQQSLYQNTMIETDKRNVDIKTLANTTEQAIQSGCTLAIVGLIEHILNEIQKTTAKEIYCILSGGDAERIKGLLPDNFILEPHIVLKGLSVMARKNI